MKKNSQQLELTPIETALQVQYKPTAENCEKLIQKAYTETENAQNQSLVQILTFGLLALAIKPIVGHGKFGEWLKKAVGGEISKTTAYRWIGASKYLIQKIETAQNSTDIISSRICEFIDLHDLDQNASTKIFETAKSTVDFIEYVSNGLPFASFLTILRNANANALALEDSEKNQKRSKESHETNDGQLTFFNALFRDTRAQIETARENPNFMKLTKAEMLEYGNYLMAQARDVLGIAQGMNR